MSQQKFDPRVYGAMKNQLNPATGKTYTNYEIARHLGVDEASVRRGLAKPTSGFHKHLVPTGVVTQLRRDLEKPIVLNSAELGAGAVTADWHHPLTNYELVNTFIEQARDLKATNYLLVAGDWFNIDSLSQFDFKQEGADLESEMLGSTATIEALFKTFKRVIFSWGNHDARIHKTLGYKVSFARAMGMMFADLDPKLFKRISFTNLDHVYVDTPARGRYLFAHPSSYNSVPLTSAIRLASKYLCHVLTGHSHHTALGYDRSGQFVVGELGGFFDAEQTQYLQRTTSFPRWTNGYGFLSKDGFLQMESEGWSNFIQKRRG
jgi:hypothetical protein